MRAKVYIHIFYLMVIMLAGGCKSTPPLPAITQSTLAPPVCPTPSPLPADFSAVGVEDIYLIGSGDVLKVMVYDEPEISGNFRVSRQGTISWAWVGNIEVAGLTVEEIKERLEQVLGQEYIWQPRVVVDVKEYQSQVVYFFGNVVLPGITRLGENRSLLQNLLQAGGPRVWGDSAITILRTNPKGVGQETITLSLQSLLSGELGEDVLLQNRDIITIASADMEGILISENRVYIVGAVNKPGSFPWRENLTALDALMAAGGLADYASGNRSRLVRGTGEKQEEIRVRFGDILDGEKDKNIFLLPGDLIIVPESFF